MGAENGLIGVQLAQLHKFDLIICDVMMPELDGYGVIEALRDNPQTADIPFIFLTAKGDRADLRQGMILGADDYLTKPCTNQELIEAISARLKRAAVQNEKLDRVSEKLEQLEKFDALTGLPNQSVLEGEGGYLTRAIAQTDRNNKLVPFLLLGLDRFGRINEAIGYAKGNEILQKLAERLVEFSEKIEGAGAVRLVADEFAVILPPVSSEEAAAEVAKDLLQVISKPFNLSGKSILLTGTIGIAFYPQARDFEDMRRQAGTAMAEAKRSGGNSWKIYSRPAFGNQASKDLQLVADLHRAKERKSLQVFYQPRFDLRKNKIIGAAAVVYWQHPLLGAISPSKLAAVAEEAGLVLPLGEWLLLSALEQAKIWNKERMGIRAIVSLPEPLFKAANLLEMLEKTARSGDINPRNLELEVAADTIANARNVNEMALKLVALKRLGIQTTLSQFRLEHASLSYLGDLAIDAIKLDRSAIINAEANAPIVSAIAQLARGIQRKVIAGGIETDAQVAVLKKQKCDEIQEEQAFPEQEIRRLWARRGWL